MTNEQLNAAVANLHTLHMIVIFGIGSLFLYLIVPVALLANEVRLAKQSDDTSGAAPILTAMVQSAYSIVAWLLFITSIVFIMVASQGSIDRNPAPAIWKFWAIDWINVLSTWDVGGTEVLREQSQTLILLLKSAQVVEIIALGVLLMLTLMIAMSLPLYKLRRVQHYQMTSDINISSAITYLMIFLSGMVMFQLIVRIDNLLLQSIMTLANSISHVGVIVDVSNNNLKGYIYETISGDKGLNILEILWQLIDKGKSVVG